MYNIQLYRILPLPDQKLWKYEEIMRNYEKIIQTNLNLKNIGGNLI